MEGKHTRGASNSSSSMLVNSAASLLPANYELLSNTLSLLLLAETRGCNRCKLLNDSTILLSVNVFVYRDPYFDTLLVLTA